MSARVPVLFDTDIGNDIDDAVALAYLLRQERCELIGVTCVTGDVEKRCALAEAVCRAAGRDDVPIHAGASQVLLHGPGQPHVPQYEAIAGKPHRAHWPAGTAYEFMRKIIRERPGEVTLLSVGPLTNLAVLFAIDPGVPPLLKEVVSMAGVFFDSRWESEWNCRVDPVATGMVYAARPPRHRSVGLDVTTKCVMSAQEMKEKFVAPPLDLVRELAAVWFRDRKEMTFHDPLAAACIFRPGLCEWVSGTVTVDPGSDPKQGGSTRLTAGNDACPHLVARTVDPAAFFSEYFSVFK